MKNIARIAASTVALTAGFGLAGLGAAAVAQAQPAPFPDYHWCPGAWWDPGWGGNWAWDRCHDDHFFDGDDRDGGHWHNGPYDRDWRGDDHWQGGNFGDHDRGPGGNPGDHDRGPGGNPGDQDHGPGGNPGGQGHGH